MRTFTAIFIGIIWSTMIYGECSDEMYINVFPNRQIIKQNPIFVIDGYNCRYIIHELGKQYIPYLVSENSKIKLLIQEVLDGELNITQAILIPESKLEAGKEYTLNIDSLSTKQQFKRYNPITQKREPIIYKVIPGIDTQAPILLRKPQLINKTLRYFGCGPEIYMTFDFPVTDSSEVIIKTTVKCIKTGKSTTYYIEPADKKIDVGSDMCGGPFTYDYGKIYEVEFIFMDSYGNRTNWNWKGIRFTKPTKWTRD